MDEIIYQPDLVRMPTRIEDLGVPIGMVEDLFMRRVLTERQTTIHDASESLGISTAIGRALADTLRDKKLVEYFGLEGRDYRIGLTEHGFKVTAERMVGNNYASYLPVPLVEYVHVIEAQAAEMDLNRETIRAAFGDLVVADELLDQLGPAFLSNGAIFLYGPPGTGKTSLAERMIKLYHDRVMVPRAVEVDGSIIVVYDPETHKPVEPQPPNIDPRWVLCERPIVIVGGELGPKMLDLEYDTISGTYTAPIQMQANNGILVVDDLGRQLIRPDELLNRWIVPLSRGIDFLRLVNGAKFTVPFELKLVASTNLDPNELGDDAFLRRLRNKVFVGPISDTAFNWILVRTAQARKIEVSAESAQHLRQVCKHFLGELRPYVAVDFCDLMLGICRYDNMAPVLDIQMINRVASVYFVNDGASMPPEFLYDPSAAGSPAGSATPTGTASPAQTGAAPTGPAAAQAHSPAPMAHAGPAPTAHAVPVATAQADRPQPVRQPAATGPSPAPPAGGPQAPIS